MVLLTNPGGDHSRDRGGGSSVGRGGCELWSGRAPRVWRDPGMGSVSRSRTSSTGSAWKPPRRQQPPGRCSARCSAAHSCSSLCTSSRPLSFPSGCSAGRDQCAEPLGPLGSLGPVGGTEMTTAHGALRAQAERPGESRPLRVAVEAIATAPGGGLSYLRSQLPELERQGISLLVFARPAVAADLRDALRSPASAVRVVDRRSGRFAAEFHPYPAGFAEGSALGRRRAVLPWLHGATLVTGDFHRGVRAESSLVPG